VGPRKALDRELPHGQTAKSSLRPQTPETMNSVQPTVSSSADIMNGGQTITHEVALRYLRRARTVHSRSKAKLLRQQATSAMTIVCLPTLLLGVFALDSSLLFSPSRVFAVLLYEALGSNVERR
jgi:hypothetical protein